MDLLLKRKTRTTKSTEGELHINGSFECYTLEDVDRGLKQSMPLDEIKMRKIKGETCIPEGRYRVIKQFWPKHGKHFLMLVDVPGYQGIFIHVGNKADDSEGCLLVGSSNTKQGDDFIEQSKKALEALETKAFLADSKGEEIWITIQ